MKPSRALKTILLVSGLIAMGVGSAIQFWPVAFHASNGIELGKGVSLLNEIRASGGVLLACGALIVSGAFVVSLAFTSTVVATLLYLSYGLSRLLSMAIDGIPAGGIVQAAALEMSIGLVCAFALARYRQGGKGKPHAATTDHAKVAVGDTGLRRHLQRDAIADHEAHFSL